MNDPVSMDQNQGLLPVLYFKVFGFLGVKGLRACVQFNQASLMLICLSEQLARTLQCLFRIISLKNLVPANGVSYLGKPSKKTKIFLTNVLNAPP